MDLTDLERRGAASGIIAATAGRGGARHPDGSGTRSLTGLDAGVAANFNSFSPSPRNNIDGEIPVGTRVKDQRRLREHGRSPERSRIDD